MVADQQGRNARRVGELAAATGLTVRTLHYYEEIGLLVPSGRSYAGHRLYRDADIARLYRICLLRRLGLPLAEISRALDDAAWSLRPAIAAHLGELDRRLDAAGRLRTRLAVLLDSADASDGRLSNQLLTLLEEMTMLDTTVQRRITLLVYADIAAAHDWLVRSLASDLAGWTVTGRAGLCTASCTPATASSGCTRRRRPPGWPHRDRWASPRPPWR